MFNNNANVCACYMYSIIEIFLKKHHSNEQTYKELAIMCHIKKERWGANGVEGLTEAYKPTAIDKHVIKHTCTTVMIFPRISRRFLSEKAKIGKNKSGKNDTTTRENLNRKWPKQQSVDSASKSKIS